MPRRTLLDLTQSILSDINSDNVNSITDTPESLQIVSILKKHYYSIIDELDIPRTERLVQLDASGDNALPVQMKIPNDVVEVSWIKYDVRDSVSGDIKYEDINYLTPKTFLDYIMQRTESDSNIDNITHVDGTPLLIKNDERPHYYTTFDDQWIVFDSFNSSIETTLQSSKCMCGAVQLSTFTQSDSFLFPELPDRMFSYLLHQATSDAMIKLAGTSDPKEEQAARRHRISNQRHKAVAKDQSVQTPNYGRK